MANKDITDLTKVTTLADTDAFEVSGGKYIEKSDLAVEVGGVANAAVTLGTMRPLTDFTQINIASNRFCTESSGKAITMGYTAADATLRIAGIRRAVPTPPYRIAIFVQVNAASQRFMGLLFGFSDGTKYRSVNSVALANTVATGNIALNSWSDKDTRSATGTLANAHGLSFGNTGFWLGLRDDNAGTVSWEYSADGVYFSPLYRETKSSGYLGSSGYTNAFISAFCNTAGGDITTDFYSSVTVREWDEAGLSRSF